MDRLIVLLMVTALCWMGETAVVDYRVPVAPKGEITLPIGNPWTTPLLCVNDRRYTYIPNLGGWIFDPHSPPVQTTFVCWHVMQDNHTCHNVKDVFGSTQNQFNALGYEGVMCFHTTPDCSGDPEQAFFYGDDDLNSWRKTRQLFQSFQTQECQPLRPGRLNECECVIRHPQDEEDEREAANCTPKEHLHTLNRYGNLHGKNEYKVTYEVEMALTATRTSYNSNNTQDSTNEKEDAGGGWSVGTEVAAGGGNIAGFGTGPFLTAKVSGNLYRNYEKSIGHSKVTDFNWATTTQTSSNTKVRHMYYLEIPVGTTTVLEQLWGICGPFLIKTGHIQRTDYNADGKRFNNTTPTPTVEDFVYDDYETEGKRFNE